MRDGAIRYLSGMESADIKPGYWMSQWFVEPGDAHAATFSFEPELHMVFGFEWQALGVSEALRVNREIETEVVHIR